MWKHRISSTSLLNRAGLWTIDMYISQRQLRWLGHVVRMDFDRLPRQMLSCWVDRPRPRGAPQFTYARGIYKAMKKYNLNKDIDWTWIAHWQDRYLWSDTLTFGTFV